MRKIFTPFTCLNGAQFFAGMNDNLFKLLLAFFLIHIEGKEHSNRILATAGAIFVIPFILFAATSGTITDKFSKRAVILITRITEVIVLAVGVIAFAIQSEILGYSILFLMATQSALLSPPKYGIIPELVPREKVIYYNGIFTLTLYASIILGTFLASFLAQATHYDFVLSGSVCVLVAILGTFCSLGIPKTEPKAKNKKITTHFITDIYRTIVRAKKIPYLRVAIIFGAYFLFFAAYTQLNMIPFVTQSLNLTPEEGGYLFLITLLGVGVGSLLAGRLKSEQDALAASPFTGIAISCLSMGLFLFANSLVAVIILLIFLGLLGGFYIVPLDAYLQNASPVDEKGENIAASNFLSFIGVIIASGLLALLGTVLKLSAATGFLVMGIITAVTSTILFFIMADQVVLLLMAGVAHIIWKLTLQEKKETLRKATLFVANTRSFKEIFIAMAMLPRVTLFVFPLNRRFSLTRIFLHLFRFVPIDLSSENSGLREIFQVLNNGFPVCFIGKLIRGSYWENNFLEMVEEKNIPIRMLHINYPKGKKRWIRKQIDISMTEVYIGW